MAKNDETKPDADVDVKPAAKGPAKVDETAGLVKMRKGDELLYVHPTCVKAHEKAEWQVA